MDWGEYNCLDKPTELDPLWVSAKEGPNMFTKVTAVLYRVGVGVCWYLGSFKYL